MAKAAGVIPKSTDTETDVVSGDELGRDAFLQLLVLQMQHQDPMEPTDNSQMLAQLAQFSSLEQMNNLNDSFEMLSGNVDQLNFITANSLLGRTIHGVDSAGEAVNGVVDSVYLNGSLVYLRVGEQLVSMAGVASIEEPAS
jgi:flagellar basal-body rod modification protein FlgD